MKQYKVKTDIILERSNNITRKVYLSCATPNEHDIAISKDTVVNVTICNDNKNFKIKHNKETYYTYDMYNSPFKYLIDTSIETELDFYKLFLEEKVFNGKTVDDITTELYEFTDNYPRFEELFLNNKSFQYEVIYHTIFMFDGATSDLIRNFRTDHNLYGLVIEIQKFKSHLLSYLCINKWSII